VTERHRRRHKHKHEHKHEHKRKGSSILREWGESLLIVAILAIIIRSFIVAPFKIPSSSMVPTLEVGDYIFVLRFPYGLRIPFTDVQLFPKSAERGDVVVFDYPEDRSKDYIKRIVGLPGDNIRYEDNKLFVNDVEMPLKSLGKRTYFLSDDRADVSGLFRERMINKDYQVLRKETSIKDGQWTVPDGQYFVLGDNRNNSRDSRFWGFVPQSYLVGKATIVWWSWDAHKESLRGERIGKFVE